MQKVKTIAVRAIVLMVLLTVVAPLVWMIYTSLKTAAEIFASPWALPEKPQWDNFARAWTKANIGRYMTNSIIVTVISVAFIVLLSAMAAYALVRFPSQLSSWMLNGFMLGLMVPVQVALVPLHSLLRNLELLDTHLGLILVYIAFSLPFTIYLLSGFFRTLPAELEDAAAIDGCSRMGAFWLVMVPIAQPALVTATIFNSLGIWNEFLLALIILGKDELKTLPLGLANLQMVMRYQTDWGALFAGLVISLLPVLIIYICLHDRIAEGITIGALKG